MQIWLNQLQHFQMGGCVDAAEGREEVGKREGTSEVEKEKAVKREGR